MIIDKLSNVPAYYALGGRIAAGLRYLQETDLVNIDPGKYQIDGANVYAVVTDYDTKPAEQGFWEAHRRYIDIQYVASGLEHIGYANVNDLTSTGPYDEEKDLLRFRGQGNMLLLSAGTFVILFPQDGHMPGITINNPVPARKVVVKLLAD